MKKFLVLCALVLSFSGQEAFAAKFFPLTTFKNARLEKFSKAASAALDGDILGDASRVTAVRFTRNATEQDYATTKQLNIAKHGIWVDDGEDTFVVNDTIAKKIIDEMITQGGSRTLEEMTDWLDAEEKKAFYDARYALIMGLIAATNNFSDPTIALFGAGHANEDGTWGVLNLFDKKNQQILSIVIGSHGT